jgi:hypothetical protein
MMQPTGVEELGGWLLKTEIYEVKGLKNCRRSYVNERQNNYRESLIRTLTLCKV